MKLRQWVVDAFTDRVFSGNPAAVILTDGPLPETLMRAVAAENNLSETAFAVREGEAWHLRWFTPTVEVDLCGHATLATAWVLASLGHQGPFRFRTRSGLLTAARAEAAIVLDLPARPARAVAEPEGMAAALGARPLSVFRAADLVAVMASPAVVAGLRPDSAAIARLPGGAVIVTAEGGEGADITSRYFAPAYGIAEDPVTGSLHTQIMPYWAARLGRTRLVCHQASRRGGTMCCTLVGDRVLLEGCAVLFATAELEVPDEASEQV